MPTPALNKRIKDALFQLDRTMQATGFAPMTPDELRRAYGQLYQVAQQQMSPQGLPPGGSRIYGDVNPPGAGFQFRNPVGRTRQPGTFGTPMNLLLDPRMVNDVGYPPT